MFPDDLLMEAARVLDGYRAAGRTLATAESCTGGLIAAALTEVAGSSDVVERGFVTYSNEAKNEMLGVPSALIERDGAVSETVAKAMAAGALAHARVDAAVAVTGVAGPGGGSEAKPVGLVHFGLAVKGREPDGEHQVFTGDRGAVRLAATRHALALLLRGLPA